MYENYTYDQLKALPDDKKIEALKELKTLYPDNKDLAKHLSIATIAISNMVGKYLEGKQVGRRKMTDEEKAQAKIEREAKKLKQSQKQQTQTQQQEKLQQEPNKEQTQNQEIKDEKFVKVFSINPSFNITLDKDLSGEEAILRLNGIANSLLQDNKYKVHLNIEEIEEV
jgi:outer membrane protein OmpA-like peptidoglycan-associated protein